ncbi:hypothetical protein ES703_117641 [subsurface metagenome]
MITKSLCDPFAGIAVGLNLPDSVGSQDPAKLSGHGRRLKGRPVLAENVQDDFFVLVLVCDPQSERVLATAARIREAVIFHALDFRQLVTPRLDHRFDKLTRHEGLDVCSEFRFPFGPGRRGILSHRLFDNGPVDRGIHSLRGCSPN